MTILSLSRIVRGYLPWILRTLQALAACLMLAFLALPACSQEIDNIEKKNVLVVYDEQDKLPGLAILDSGLRSTLLSDPSIKIDVFTENLDRSRFQDDEHDDILDDYFREKYRDKKIDAIIAVMGPSLDFLLTHAESFAPGTPIIFCGVDRREIESRKFGENVTGLLFQREFRGTLETVLQLQPETKRAIYVGGTSTFDKRVTQQAETELRPYADRVNIEYWTDFELGELLKKVSALPPDSVVLISTVFRDNTGKSYVPHDVVSLVSHKSSVPVYGFMDQYLGRGIVGGRLYSLEAHGKKAADLALQVLNGQPPSQLPISETSASVNMFDARELRRWQIDEATLPAGSIVKFDQPSAFEAYRGYVAIGIALLLIQSVLITALLLTRSRRRRAELERNEFQALAAAEHVRLDEIVSNVPGIVWESRVVDNAGKRRAAFVSSYVEQMLGYTVEECLADPDFIRSKVVPEHRKPYQRDADSVFLTGESRTVQYKCMTKGGGWKWAESLVIPVRDETGKIVGLRGVTLDITDRKKAEEQLGTKEQQLVEAQRVAQVGSWEWDGETDTTIWSDEIYRIYGLDPTTRPASYAEHSKLYTPQSWERLQASVTKALKDGSPYEVELEVVRADGQHAWSSARGELVKNSGKVKFRGTLQDITARKIADEALRASEARFRNMADAAPVFIWIADPEMQCTYFNRKCTEFTGHSMDDLCGFGWLDIVHKDEVERCKSAFAAAYERQLPFVLEYRILSAGGEYRWLYDTGTPQFSSTGEFLGYIGSAIDITELKSAGEAIRESEARFRNMADTAPVKLLMTDREMGVTFFNQYFLTYTGVTTESILGDGWLRLIHEDDREHYMTAFTSALENRQRFTLELRIRRSDGEYRWVYGTATPRFATDGEFLGYIGSLVDISDRKTAEEGLRSALEQIYELKNQLHEENIYLKEVIKLEHHFEEIIGSSDELKYVLFKIEQVAPTDSTVLITGETGTGKELVARAIHKTSLRKDRPLVKVNSAALSSSLIESELFGHERGAFTGASSRKIGRFELADGATIFLDEVGELPLELQAKLLRMIQEGEFERLGSSTTLKADVRIMAATNRNLEAEVRAGRFREDLLFRLNVFPVTVPPLRDRKEDINALVQHFVNQFSKKLGKTITSISPSTLRNLSQYHWPGNVRELANVIERAVIGNRGDTLSIAEQLGDHQLVEDRNGHDQPESLASIERKHIIKTLLSTGWRIEGPNGAARILGVNPSTLRTRMAKLGIVKNDSHMV